MNKIESSRDVPEGEHYVVIEFRKVDGLRPNTQSSNVMFATYQQTVIDYYITQDEVDWIEHIRQLEGLIWKRDYIACKAKTAKIKSFMGITVEVKI